QVQEQRQELRHIARLKPLRSKTIRAQKQKGPGSVSLPGLGSLYSRVNLDQPVILGSHVHRPLAQGLAESPQQQQQLHMQVELPMKLRIFYPFLPAFVKSSRH